MIAVDEERTETPSIAPIPRGGASRFLAKAAAFTIGLLVLSWLLKPLDGYRDVEVVGEKLAHWARHKDDYDTLFIGSSYIYRQVAPAVFDAEQAARGAPTRSFNFGILGMDPPETYVLLERLLDEDPRNLRVVYIELDYLQTRVKQPNTHTRRFEYWHTPAATARILRVLAGEKTSLGWRVKQAGLHLEALARNYFNVGRGPSYVDAWVGMDEASDTGVLGPAGDGYLSTDDDTSNRMDLRREFFVALDVEVLAEKVGALRAGSTIQEEVPEAALEGLAEAIERVRAAGATPILVVPPCLDTRRALIDLGGRGIDAEILAFNDPDAYPELYDARYRFDLGHLNREGSELFTRALAARSPVAR